MIKNNIMFGFIKEMFIGLLSVCTKVRFGSSLPSIKCLTSNNLPCQARQHLLT